MTLKHCSTVLLVRTTNLIFQAFSLMMFCTRQGHWARSVCQVTRVDVWPSWLYKVVSQLLLFNRICRFSSIEFCLCCTNSKVAPRCSCVVPAEVSQPSLAPGGLKSAATESCITPSCEQANLPHRSVLADGVMHMLVSRCDPASDAPNESRWNCSCNDEQHAEESSLNNSD